MSAAAAVPVRPAPEAAVADALDALADGGLVMLDTGDQSFLVQAAERTSARDVAFMAVHGRGLVCVALAPSRCEALGFEPMPTRGGSSPSPFMVSVEARCGVTTGISAADRARTIWLMADPQATPNDFVRPGHVFPLRAAPGGVLARPEAAEAAVELAEATGAGAAAVLCGVLDDAGDVATGRSAQRFARRHALPTVTLPDVVALARRALPAVERVGTAPLPTTAGTFTAVFFVSPRDGTQHTAIVVGDPAADPAPVCIAVACAAGDGLLAPRCSCREPILAGLRRLRDEVCGVVVHVGAAAAGGDPADVVGRIMADLTSGRAR